MADVSDVSKVA